MSILPPPNNIIATAAGGSTTITWTAVPNATSYNVYRATSAIGTYTFIGTSTTNSYIDPVVGSYWYKVTTSNTALGALESGQGGPAAAPGGGARRGLNHGTE